MISFIHFVSVKFHGFNNSLDVKEIFVFGMDHNCNFFLFRNKTSDGMLNANLMLTRKSIIIYICLRVQIGLESREIVPNLSSSISCKQRLLKLNKILHNFIVTVQ